MLDTNLAPSLFDGAPLAAPESLTSGYATAELTDLEMAQLDWRALPCPRCGDVGAFAADDAGTFYGPCGPCRIELRGGGARPPAPAPAAEVLEPEHLEPEHHTRRVTRRRPAARRVAFLEVDTGRGLTDTGEAFTVGPPAGSRTMADLLAGLPGGVQRVIACGVLPWVDRESLRAWTRADLPAGWRTDERGHNVRGRWAAPMLRWRRPDGTAVELGTSTAWYGEGAQTAPAADVYTAHMLLGRVVADHLGETLRSTPASTSRAAFLRTVPEGDGWPVLPVELQDELRSQLPQHRFECTSSAGAGDTLGALVEVDGRFMYGAERLLMRAPGGVPYRARGAGEDWRTEQYQAGRYRCTWAVPDDWRHVGILPAKDDAGGWRWPAAPGERAAGWVDAGELHLARKHGWPVEVLERIVWPKDGGQPLAAWGRAIRKARRVVADKAAAGAVDQRTAELVRGALRAMLTAGLGAFTGRPFTVERWESFEALEHADSIPAGAALEGGGLAWSEPVSDPYSARMAHPEWAGAVWAGERLRVLEGPGSTGALHVPRGELVGIIGDALYVTRAPGWAAPVAEGGADDGAEGRLRLKATYPGPMPAPRNYGELRYLIDSLRAAL